MRVFLLIIFILTLGVLKSQVSIFISPELYGKMSLNSNRFSYFEPKVSQVSNLFQYENSSYTLYKPFRVGASVGIKFINNSEIITGLHFDGVSSKQKLRFATYIPEINTVIPNNTFSKSVSNQYRVYFSYNFFFIQKPNKTSLALSPIISLVWRSGPKEIASVGNFSSSSLLPDDIQLEYSNSSFTSYSKYAIQYGLGVSSNIYLSTKYLFSLSLQYSYSGSYLGVEQSKVKIINMNNNSFTNYEFQSYNRASGLYLKISKKIQIIPWIKIKERRKAHNKT